MIIPGFAHVNAFTGDIELVSPVGFDSSVGIRVTNLNQNYVTLVNIGSREQSSEYLQGLQQMVYPSVNVSAVPKVVPSAGVPATIAANILVEWSTQPTEDFLGTYPVNLIESSGSAITPGVYVLPPPTGTIADDIALASGIASGQPIIQAEPGNYSLYTHQIIPNGQVLRGAGGGSTSQSGVTQFICQTAVACIEKAASAQGMGGFQIRGNFLATTPFIRSGGTGANAGLFYNIVVRDNAVSGTHANDLAQALGAQNDKWIQCGWAGGDGIGLHFDEGYGGANFDRCEFTTHGKAHVQFNDVITDPHQVYTVPTDITFDDCIFEGLVGVSLVQIVAGTLLTWKGGGVFSCSNQPTGPVFDNQAGTLISVGDSYMILPSPKQANTIGYKCTNLCDITFEGAVTFVNVDIALNPDTTGAFFYGLANFNFGNASQSVGGTNGGTALQVAAFIAGVISQTGATNQTGRLNYNANRTAYIFSDTLDGSLYGYSKAGFGAPVSKFVQSASGISWGMSLGNLFIGGGSTASRPDATADLTRAIYYNTDTNTIDRCDGAAWHTNGDLLTWTNATLGTNGSQSSGNSVVGYTKSNSIVYIRGALTGVASGATAMFTLPVGYRPTTPKYMPCVTFTGGAVLTLACIKIDTSGNVTLVAGAGSLVVVDGISFPYEQ